MVILGGWDMSEVPLYRSRGPRALLEIYSSRVDKLFTHGLLTEVRRALRGRGGLVFKAHDLLCHSTLGLRVIKKKKLQHTPRRALLGFPLLFECRSGSLLNSPQRALPTETNVESGMSQRKSGPSGNLSNSGLLCNGSNVTL
jgi:hypothetical protein